MNRILLTLLRAFYWIAIPLYFFVYFMASKAGGTNAAFWIEGGSSPFGPASFYILVSVWTVPTLIGVVLSASGYRSILTSAMLRALVLSIPCMMGILESTSERLPIVVAPQGMALCSFVMMLVLLLPLLWLSEDDEWKIDHSNSPSIQPQAPKTAENDWPTPVPETPSQLQDPKANLAVSRNGQVIMQDVSRLDVQKMIMQGTLLLSDYYWEKGMSTWLPLSELSSNPPTQISKTNERSVGSALLSLLVSWLITILVGVIILGLIGYGNSGAEGAGRLIGTYIVLLIFVRPIFLIIEIISRAIMGKRGVDLLAP